MKKHNISKWLLGLAMFSLPLSACTTNQAPVQGEKGDKGEAGNSVVSIEKTSTEGLVDTYTITYSDGTTSTFTVTNGQSIQGEPGEDGRTPVITIGNNGNWFVDGVDTGIKAQGSQGPQGEPGIDGTSVITGNGAPSSSLGKLGDSYINLDNWDYYVREESGWILNGNIKGNTGTSIESTYIDENGDLIVEFSDGTSSNAGHVKDTETYIVNFYCDDNLIETREVLAGSKISRPSPSLFEGYTVYYWYTEEDGYTDGWNFQGCTVTSDVDLYASFDCNHYTISFVDEFKGYVVDDLIVSYNRPVILPKIVESGYVTSWADDNDTVWNDGDIYTLTTNITLRSKWTENTYEITLDPNGGSLDSTIVYATYTKTYNLPTPTRLNYVFLGWYEGDTRISSSATWNYAEDKTLVAKWTNVSNTYVFDAGDGTCETQSMTIGWEDEYELPTPIPQEGFAFDGWYLNGEPIPQIGTWNYSNSGGTLFATYVPIAQYNARYLIVQNNKITGFDPYFPGGPIEIPEGINGIDNEAFYCCAALTSIVIPNSVTYISDNAFMYCMALTSIVIPNSVTSIGSGAFYGCTSLTSIIIPDSVQIIQGNAFLACASLESVFIPKNVVMVGSDAFHNCSESIVIKCEETAKPAKWAVDWCDSTATVIWGC